MMKLKAYILPSNKIIEPFMDPVGQSMIGNMSLAQHQRKVLEQTGMEPAFIKEASEIKPGPCLVTFDDVFFTRRVLRSLLAGFKAQGSIRCGLPLGSLLVRHTKALQNLDTEKIGDEELALYRLYLVEFEKAPDSEEGLRHELKKAAPFATLFKEKIIQVQVPANIMGTAFLEHPLTSSVVMHINHWIHVLWANQLSIQIRWVETIVDHKLWTGSKAMGAAMACLLTGRWNIPALKWAMAKRLNRMGQGCDIHPTAIVEFSHIADGVRIGANALVRGCMVGSNAVIEDRACVQYSVVGRECFISKNSVLVFSAGYPQGDLCGNGTQSSLFGRKVAITSWCRIIDIKAEGDVKVEHDGSLYSTGTSFLGACWGHESYGGMDATVQAGRSVPNGAIIVKDPDQIIRTIPKDLPPGKPAWARRGVAVTEKES